MKILYVMAVGHATIGDCGRRSESIIPYLFDKRETKRIAIRYDNNEILSTAFSDAFKKITQTVSSHKTVRLSRKSLSRNRAFTENRKSHSVFDCGIKFWHKDDGLVSFNNILDTFINKKIKTRASEAIAAFSRTNTDYKVDKLSLYDSLIAKYFNSAPAIKTGAIWGAINYGTATYAVENHHTLASDNYTAVHKRLYTHSELLTKRLIILHSVISPENIKSLWADYLFALLKNRSRTIIHFNTIIYLLFQVSARPPNNCSK